MTAVRKISVAKAPPSTDGHDPGVTERVKERVAGVLHRNGDEE